MRQELEAIHKSYVQRREDRELDRAYEASHQGREARRAQADASYLDRRKVRVGSAGLLSGRLRGLFHDIACMRNNVTVDLLWNVLS